MAEKHEIRNKKKQKTFQEWMKSDHVLVHFDSRHSGVEVPVDLRENPTVTLKFSYHFQGDTQFDDKAITAYLKFAGEYQRCTIPWSSIWSMTSDQNENTVWPEDIPKEVVLQMATERIRQIAGRLFGGKKDASNEEQQRGLQLVKDSNNDEAEEDGDGDGDGDDDPDSPKDKKSGYLKRVK